MNAQKIHPSFIEVGPYSYGLESATVVDWSGGKGIIRVGNFCSIAPKVRFLIGGNHNFRGSLTTYPLKEMGLLPDGEGPHKGNDKLEINIGHDVWIGYEATIKGGVNIGTGAIIAAQSYVTRDVEPYSIVGGNPARFINLRNDLVWENDREGNAGPLMKLSQKLQESRWWDYFPVEDIALALNQGAPGILVLINQLQKLRRDS
jgi:virginiamycin A acetyltransferase